MENLKAFIYKRELSELFLPILALMFAFWFLIFDVFAGTIALVKAKDLFDEQIWALIFGLVGLAQTIAVATNNYISRRLSFSLASGLWFAWLYLVAQTRISSTGFLIYSFVFVLCFATSLRIMRLSPQKKSK